MSFYFREKPRFGDKLRGKSRDELLQELNQQFDDNSKSFFEPAATRLTRDPFERHTGFSRVSESKLRPLFNLSPRAELLMAIN